MAERALKCPQCNAPLAASRFARSAEAGRLATLGLIAGDSTLADWLAEAGAAVFEGAQGGLLDASNPEAQDEVGAARL